MANTVIQLKYSNVTGTPPSLNVAEPAYSNVSNKLWIDDGSGVVAIGGKYYTDLLDAGTSLATQNTIVRRDTSGNFKANTVNVNVINANTSVIQNGYDLYAFANAAYTMANTAMVAGGTIAGGYANSAYLHANSAYIQANTATTNAAQADQRAVTSGSYANSAYAQANTATTNAATADQRAVTSGSYANSAYTQANTATTNAATADQRAVTSGSYANSAYALANTKFASAGGTITGDVTINANLTVSGVTTYVNTQTVMIGDNILTLNADLGQAAAPSENAGIEVERGSSANVVLLWNESTDKWTFTNDGTNYSNIGSDAAESYANSAYTQANTATTNAATADQRAVTSGSYANSAYTQANTGTQYAQSAGSYANSAYSQANTATTNAATADQKAVSAGSYANSAYTQANTGTQYAQSAGSYANSAYTQANTATQYAQSAGSYANSAYAQANTDFTNVSVTAGTYGSASVVPSFRVEANGRISTITTNSIALDAGAITTGTLGVARGGTGNTAFTANHVILGNGTGALTTVGSSTEGKVLTINSSGVPTFTFLSGGSF